MFPLLIVALPRVSRPVWADLKPILQKPYNNGLADLWKMNFLLKDDNAKHFESKKRGNTIVKQTTGHSQYIGLECPERFAKQNNKSRSQKLWELWRKSTGQVYNKVEQFSIGKTW